MSSWTEFLNALSGYNEVTLVGPFNTSEHKPLTPTVYVDAGNHFRSVKRSGEELLSPCVSVGDGDSFTGEMDFLLPTQKDLSDLAFVLSSLPENITTVNLRGFLGGRRDHELANFGEVHAFLNQRQRFSRVDFSSATADFSVIAFTRGVLRINLKGVFSVFVFEPTQIVLNGACRYCLPKPTLITTASSLGLSNEGWGEVEVKSQKPCFVFRNIPESPTDIDSQ